MRITAAIIRPVNSLFGFAIGTKFSEDVIPLTDLKINPGRVVKHASDSHRPVLLTSRAAEWLSDRLCLVEDSLSPWGS
jgi:hypothetical protein